jgi:hypothetical protein
MWTNPCRFSNANGVSHQAWFKWEGKPRHASLVWARSHGEFILNLNKGSLVLELVASLFFRTLFEDNTWYMKKCGGDLPSLPSTYTLEISHTSVAQHQRHFHDKGQGKLERAGYRMGQLNHCWSTLFLIFFSVMVCAPFISPSLIHEFEWVSILIC